MGNRKQTKQDRQRQRDAEYRKAAGGSVGSTWSSADGSGHSPEPIPKHDPQPRKPDPTYRGKRRIRQRAVAPDAPMLPLTVNQQRSVACPRCLANVGQPCRNQTGRAVSAGHADRQHKARRVHRRALIQATPKDMPLTREEHTELAQRRNQVRDPARIPRRRKPRVDNGQ